MIEQLRKLRKLKKLQKKGDVCITFDNHTPKTLKIEIEKTQKTILEFLNIGGWAVVFFLLIPLSLAQTGMSHGSSVFVSVSVLFLSLFTRSLVKYGWDDTETRLILYYLIAQLIIYLIVIWDCGGSFCWEIN
mgnify:CR=1 FL=1